MNANNKVTISVTNRTGKKLQTVLYGLRKEYVLKKIIKHFKKTFSCTGNIESSEEFGDVIKLTGDHKVSIISFLITEELCSKEEIVIKGI